MAHMNVRFDTIVRLSDAGIPAALRLARAETDARALGFEHGKCTSPGIEQRVLGTTTVIERILAPHAEYIGQTPVGFFKSG